MLGSAASQGALGGDRTGVAQAVLAGQQQLAQAPVIAGLENTGYNQAVQYAMQEQANLGTQANNISGIGNTGQNTLLSGAGAQTNAGTLEQTTQQAADTANYNAYIAAQAYPFQTQQWLAGIDTSVGSQMGGTSSTTAPPPSTTAQVAGAVGAGVGAAGMFLSDRRLKEHIHKIGETKDDQPIYRFRYKGDPNWYIGLMAQDVEKSHPDAVREGEHGYKMVDIKAATDDAAKRWSGGRVAGFDQGGVVAPWQMGLGYVPSMRPTYGSGPPKAPTIPQQPGATQMMQNAASLAKAFKPGATGQPPTTTPVGDTGPIGTSPGSGYSSDNAIYYAGGMVLPKHNRIHVNPNGTTPVRGGMGLPSFVHNRRAGFADGGAPDDAAFDDRWQKPPVPAGMYGSDPTPAINGLIAYGQQSPYLPVPLPRSRPQIATDASLADDDGGIPDVAQQAPVVAPRMDDGAPMGYAGAPALPPYSAPMDIAPSAGVAPVAAPTTGGFGPSSDLWPSLMSAGLGMMASRSPFLGVAIGEGGLQGMNTYGQLQKQHLAEKKQAEDVDIRVKQLNQQAKAEQDRMTQAARPYSEMTAAEKASHNLRLQAEQRQEMQPVKIGTSKEGYDIYGRRDPSTGAYKIIDPRTGGLTDQVVSPSPNTPNYRIPGATSPPGSVASTGEDGTIPANARLVSGGAYDYTQDAPYIEKGMGVPDPQATSGRSSRALQTDAEYYLTTGKLPPVRSGKSPVAIQQQNYRNAVQNYGNAVAESRGLSAEQTAEMWRTAPGMLRFVLGPDGRSTVSLGTAVRHLDTLSQLAKAWDAGDVQTINKVKAAISREFGGSAVTNLESAAQIVGPEIIKAIGVAGAGTDHDRLAASSQFSAARGPAQVLGAIGTTQQLLGGQLEGRTRQAMNAGVSEERFKSLIGDRPYEILSNIDKGGAPATTAPAAAPQRKPSQSDIDYARGHPEVRAKFIQTFGVEP